MKKLRLLLITLCLSVLMGSLAVTAYAGGRRGMGPPVVEETPVPEPAPTITPARAFPRTATL